MLQEVLDFFTSLIKFLGDHIEFVVQPTLHDGMVVGIQWRLGLPLPFLYNISIKYGINLRFLTEFPLRQIICRVE